MDLNHRPPGYGPGKLPLLYLAIWTVLSNSLTIIAISHKECKEIERKRLFLDKQTKKKEGLLGLLENNFNAYSFGSVTTSLIVVAKLATFVKLLGRTIFVAFPSATFARASRYLRVKTLLSHSAFLSISKPSASA